MLCRCFVFTGSRCNLLNPFGVVVVFNLFYYPIYTPPAETLISFKYQWFGRVIKQIKKRLQPCLALKYFPANTMHQPNAGPMLVHRLRRWPNIVPALGWCIVFAGLTGCGRRKKKRMERPSLVVLPLPDMTLHVQSITESLTIAIA